MAVTVCVARSEKLETVLPSWRTRVPIIAILCAKLAPPHILLIGNTMYMKSAISLALLACCVPAHADGTAAALYKTGSLTVDVSGPDVGMQLRLPMTRGDTSGASKPTLTTAEVVARLKDA